MFYTQVGIVQNNILKIQFIKRRKNWTNKNANTIITSCIRSKSINQPKEEVKYIPIRRAESATLDANVETLLV